MTELTDKDGFIYYRIDGKRVSKHKYLYEQRHGEIKKGEVVIFLDGNRRNFDISNLYKLTRGELVTLNNLYGISENREETLVSIMLVKVRLKRTEIAEKAGLTDKYGNIIEDQKENHHRWYTEHPEPKEKVNKRVKEWYRMKRLDPEWRAEYNRKQRERRYERKVESRIKNIE